MMGSLLQSSMRRFKGLWASDLSIAFSLGYRDAKEASWSQLVDERIVDSTTSHVRVYADGSFGNFYNARLLARKLRRRGAGGVEAGSVCGRTPSKRLPDTVARVLSSCRSAGAMSWTEAPNVSFYRDHALKIECSDCIRPATGKAMAK
ncbi:hypothetical protein [Bradyrhizobium sp. CCBAU 45389]|uniref:hypothetical protein n=1 Tax=Bradyrhizobium sp. CCBAU 45389 TaxID=858429 RepID=UPI002FE041E4